MVESVSVSLGAEKQAPPPGGQALRDERRPARDEPPRTGTGGLLRLLSGDERRALLAGWAVGAPIALAVTAFNILTRLHDYPARDVRVSIWDEASSAITTLVAFVSPAAAAVWVRRAAPRWWRVVLIHGLGLAAYSTVHVGGFVLLRSLGFAAVGVPYSFGPLATELPYEVVKDAVAYAMAAAGFTFLLRWSWPPAPGARAPEPRWFDIRDGARLLRTPLSEVVAVRSAGNYVQFVLSDGRRPMTRASLCSVETELAPDGFVRTHRSWLVNAARVTGLRPEGSGDYVVELGALEAPLSRRWREALEALRTR